MEKIIELLLKIIDILTGNIESKDEERETPEPDYKGEAVLGIIIGHTKKSGGATFALGGNEYSYNTEVANMAKSYASQKYSKNLKLHIITRDNIGISGAYAKANDLECDAVIELHFNAFNKKVKGTETLATSHIGDSAFAQAIQEAMCKVFKRQGLSRGVKNIARSARGGHNVYSFPKGYNCLVEPFFGDNTDEARLASEVQRQYAHALVDQSVSFFKNHLGILS